MCGNIDGLYGNIIQNAVSALRFVIRDELKSINILISASLFLGVK